MTDKIPDSLTEIGTEAGWNLKANVPWKDCPEAWKPFYRNATRALLAELMNSGLIQLVPEAQVFGAVTSDMECGTIFDAYNFSDEQDRINRDFIIAMPRNCYGTIWRN